jgi:thiol-disulfide isomerase/thioredoxin
MKKRIPLYLIPVLISLASLHCGRNQGEGELAIGRSAPDFRLSDLRGHEVTLAQYQGKVVILDFWATWCGPCRMSMPLLEKLQKENPNELKLLAINLEEPLDLVRDYISRQNFQSTVLLDSEGKVGRAYQSESIPMQVVIDKKGLISSVHVGFSPRLADQLRGEIAKLHSD